MIEEIRVAKQQRLPPKSEKNIYQQSLFDEAGIELPEEVKAELEEDDVEVKSYTRKKYPIRRPLPAYLPREEVVHDLPDHEKFCACGEDLVRIGEEISEQLKYIPAR